jgi:hypothetical protein
VDLARPEIAVDPNLSSIGIFVGRCRIDIAVMTLAPNADHRSNLKHRFRGHYLEYSLFERPGLALIVGEAPDAGLRSVNVDVSAFVAERLAQLARSL